MEQQTYQDICTFCGEVSGQSSPLVDLGVAADPSEYILAESAHFVAVPCIGPLTDWYVLVVSRRHTLSSAWFTEEERRDLRTFLAEVRARLLKASGHPVVTFEHGSYDFRNRGGSCQDHAHVHLVATGRPIAELHDIVNQHVVLEQVDDWTEAAREMVQSRQRSYLAVSSDVGDYISTAEGAPSQFFRRSLTSWLEVESDTWDWLVFPHVERLRRMITNGLPEL